MALKSDDSDLKKTWLQTHFGGNGDYYITIISKDEETGLKSTSTVRIAISGGNSPRESKIRQLVSELHWEMEKHNLNEFPDGE
jgi:hypothetical protein